MDAKTIADDRLAVVDVFRFLCIAAVVGFHYTVRWTPPRVPQNLPELTHHFPAYLNLGMLGVHVFFIISGLVIPITLMRSKSIPDFVVRRFARLYPTFLICCTISFLISYIIGISTFRTDAWTYLGNISGAVMFGSHVRYIEGGYWSLAVELKFYLVAALCWGFLGRRFWLGLLAIAVVGALTPPSTKFSFPDLLPLFLIGTGQWLWLLNDQRRNGITLIVCSVVLFLFENRHLPPGGTIFILSGGAFLGAAIRFCPTISLGRVAYLGQASYAMYLINEHAGIGLMRHLTKWGITDDYLKIAIAIVVVYAIAISIFQIEEPAKRRILQAWRSGLPWLRSGAASERFEGQHPAMHRRREEVNA